MRNIFTVLFMVMAFGFGCGISDEGVDASCSSDAAQTDNAVQTDVSCVPHDCELENPVGFQCVEGTFFNEKKCMCVVVLKQGCVACKPGTDNDDACDKLGYTGECDENGECIRECVLKENGSACRDMDHQCWNGECQKKCYDDTDCPDKCRQ